jgi:hypothetical protein
MIAGLASLIITLGIIVLVIRRIAVGRRSGIDFADEVKDFFQYLILLILIVIVNTGLSGLISYALGADKRLIANQDLLARDSAYVVVATPLLIALSLWTRRTLERDEESRESFALLLYLTLVQVISFGVFATAGYSWILKLVDTRSFSGEDLGSALIWLVTLVFHYRMSQERLSTARRQLPFLILSGIALVLTIVATARLIRGLMIELLPFAETLLTTAGPNELARALILTLIALPAWYFYWFRNQSRTEATQLWNIYLLIIGIAGSLVTAIVSVSIVFYDILVWFLGDTSTNAAWIHFDGLPAATGALIGGLFSFTYHSSILRSHQGAEEGEIGRIYRYLLAAIGIVTTAVGAVTLVVSVVESLIQENQLVGRSPRNALLLAITLLVAGFPLWRILWSQIKHHISADPTHELSSISRKVYLFTLVGVSAIAAVVSTLTITVQIFQGLFGGDLGGATLRETSYAISILIVGILAGIFHLRIIQRERGSRQVSKRTHRYLLLIGPKDRTLERELVRSTGARVEIIASQDGLPSGWDRSEIEKLLAEHPDQELALIADEGKVRAIPIKR